MGSLLCDDVRRTALNPPPSPVPPSVIECFKHSAQARTDYLRAYGLSGSTPSIPAAQPSSTPMRANATDVDEVALVQAGSLLEIPTRINGAITLNFIIDSGASDVQIPLDVFSTLVRANTIQDGDIIGEQTYTLADGSEKKASKFLIRELKIGHYILHNVPGSVGSPTGSLLLGQSFLSHFDSWTLDNKQHLLKLVGKEVLRRPTRSLHRPVAMVRWRPCPCLPCRETKLPPPKPR